jgi:hypothetical protein
MLIILGVKYQEFVGKFPKALISFSSRLKKDNASGSRLLSNADKGAQLCRQPDLGELAFYSLLRLDYRSVSPKAITSNPMRSARKMSFAR